MTLDRSGLKARMDAGREDKTAILPPAAADELLAVLGDEELLLADSTYAPAGERSLASGSLIAVTPSRILGVSSTAHPISNTFGHNRPNYPVTVTVQVRSMAQVRSVALDVECFPTEVMAAALSLDIRDGTTIKLPSQSAFGTLDAELRHALAMISEAIRTI